MRNAFIGPVFLSTRESNIDTLFADKTVEGIDKGIRGDNRRKIKAKVIVRHSFDVDGVLPSTVLLVKLNTNFIRTKDTYAGLANYCYIGHIRHTPIRSNKKWRLSFGRDHKLSPKRYWSRLLESSQTG